MLDADRLPYFVKMGFVIVNGLKRTAVPFMGRFGHLGSLRDRHGVPLLTAKPVDMVESRLGGTQPNAHVLKNQGHLLRAGSSDLLFYPRAAGSVEQVLTCPQGGQAGTLKM